jgi:hypothetical protein
MGSQKAPKVSAEQKRLASAQADATYEQQKLSREQYDWSRQQAEIDRQRGDEQFNWYRGLQDEAMTRSRRLDDRYWNTTAKQEDAFYDAVNKYDTAAERDRMAGRAMADVESAAELGRGAWSRGLAARNLNAGSSAAILGLMDGEGDTALAKAAAATASQAAAREKGFNLRAMAAGLGGNTQGASSAYMNQASGAGGDALQAGGQGLRSAQAAWSGFNQGQNTAIGWGQSANSTFNSINQYNLGRAQQGGGFNVGGALLGGLKGFASGGLWGAGIGALGGGLGKG